MRAIADDEIELTRAFGEEMSYYLGCPACATASPASVDYAHVFEVARADVEKSGVMTNPVRPSVRTALLKILLTHPRLLRLVGRFLWLYQASGGQWLFRRLGLTRLLPKTLRELEPMTPVILPKFSHQLIAPVERSEGTPRYRVGLLTGCVQDLIFADINSDTADVLLANGFEAVTPPVLPCCGSIHGLTGDDALDDADPEGDGNVNFLEYALGTNPGVSDSLPVTFPPRDPISPFRPRKTAPLPISSGGRKFPGILSYGRRPRSSETPSIYLKLWTTFPSEMPTKDLFV
jgi:Fe-S oxidoreductase